MFTNRLMYRNIAVCTMRFDTIVSSLLCLVAEWMVDTKGPGPLSDSVVRSDQSLQETSGADQGNHFNLRPISLVRSVDFTQ